MARARVNFVHPLLRARDYQNRPEFDRLCEWWRRGGQGVCALVGIGGAGKTAVADRFLRVLPGAMADDPNLPKDGTLAEPGALFVFSFYDAANPDGFVAELAAWLEDRPPGDPAKKYSYEQTVRLLQRAGDCLLVLDGLEKVQDPGLRGGAFCQITDDRVRDIVHRAAEGFLPGVRVIVTTRFHPYEPLAARSPLYLAIAVEQLHPRPAVALLRKRGVHRGTDDQLEAVARDQGFHALSVDLVGGYIAHFCEGDPARLPPDPHDQPAAAADDALDPRLAATRKQERRFSRLTERYSEALLQSDPAAMALLQRVCLFRLGVEAKTLASIFTGEGKEGISGPDLATLSFGELAGKLQKFAAMRLIEVSHTEKGAVPSFTVHPAVRDAFLAGLDDETSRRGHDAARVGLEASLGGKPATNPSDAAPLDLLEEIVYHTLSAGCPQEAWDIYRNRIGGYENLGLRLGAYERGERICRSFFGKVRSYSMFERLSLLTAKKLGQTLRSTSDSPLSLLNKESQISFLEHLAHYLSALGHLQEAVVCESSYLGMQRRKHLENLAVSQSRLAGLLLRSGRLVPAARAAEEAVEAAVKAVASSAAYEAYLTRGRCRTLVGECDSARADFDDALYMQHSASGIRHRELRGRGAVWLASLLLGLRRHEAAASIAELNMGDTIGQLEPDWNLILAELAREQGDLPAARKLLAEAHDWAIARNAKEPLCRSALVRARIELSASPSPATNPDRATDSPSVAHAAPTPIAIADAIEDGLRIARDCGFGIDHIDLLLLRAQVALYEGRADDAERDVGVSLNEGMHPPADSGLPDLLAADDAECGYAWGIAEGRHLFAEVLLLQAARKLGSRSYEPRSRTTTPAVRELIKRARAELKKCARLRKRIQDPKLAETEQALQDLSGGALTNYPLEPIEPAEPSSATDGRTTVTNAKLTAKDIFLGAGNAALAAAVAATGAASLPAAVVGTFAFQCLQQLWAKRREGLEIQPKELAQQTEALREALQELGIDVDRNLDQIRLTLELLGTSLNNLGEEVHVLREMDAEHARSIDGLLSITDRHEAAIRCLIDVAQRGEAPANVKAALTAEVILAPFVDGDAMVDKLKSCSSGIFRLVVRYLKPSPGVLPGERAAQAERAADLVDWIESGDGPGLGALYSAYKRANQSGGAVSTELLEPPSVEDAPTEPVTEPPKDDPDEPEMGSEPVAKKHVFLSYCHDNATEVTKLHDDLIAAGEAVWWDEDIMPGEDWKFAIRQAMKDSYGVVLCLSKEAEARATSGMFPEALDAIAAYREYGPGSIFLIPVRLSKCTIPPFEIDGTRTLDRLQYVDLFPVGKRSVGLQRLVESLKATPLHP